MTATPTRFVTNALPEEENKVTVRDSRNGTLMPSVGNGYIGTVIFSDSVHVSGVFNGKAYPKKKPYPVYFYQHAHRARIPSTASIDFSVVQTGLKGTVSYALDVHEGVFYKRFQAEKLVIQERIYAHRSRKNLLVVEVAATNKAKREFSLAISSHRGEASRDIKLEDTQSNRAEALAAVGKVRTMAV